jgi:PAS domain S-box-containing protein
MATEMTETGIAAVGAMPWGTHFCHFYNTGQDLLDILVPYFTTGLINRERCIWLVFDPLNQGEAIHALMQTTPDIDQHLTNGDIRILPHTDWYLRHGTSFDLQQTIRRWQQELAEATESGYTGLRVSGNEAWLTEADWKTFAAYEDELNRFILNQRIILLCTFPLAANITVGLHEIARTHQFSISKRGENWEVLETSELKQANRELKALSEDLVQRVDERTSELASANADLKTEATARRRIERSLRESDDRFRQLAENIPEVFWMRALDFKRVIYISPLYESVWGRPREEVMSNFRALISTIHLEDRPRAEAIIARPSGAFELEYRIIKPDGSVRWIWDRGFPIRDQYGEVYRFGGLAADITERCEAAQRLRTTSEQLRALTASIDSEREEERARISREIHDELGSALSSLKWDIEGLQQLVTDAPAHPLLPGARKTLEAMVGLTDATITSVKRIASELRPGILDLGLVEAINWQAQQFQARTKIICNVVSTPEMVALDRGQSTAVFRIFQETLTNVLRHARAGRVDISIDDRAGEFILTVHDDGKGISEGPQTNLFSLGLLGMQERARLLGGTFEIKGAKGKGTTVTVRIPLRRHQGAELQIPVAETS